jgi:hypothetical protein
VLDAAEAWAMPRGSFTNPGETRLEVRNLIFDRPSVPGQGRLFQPKADGSRASAT